MTIYLSSSIKKKIAKLVKKHPDLSLRLDEKFLFLPLQPKHPSLRLHKLHHRQPPTWSISVAYDIRVLFVYVKDGIVIVDIGTHDEVY